MDARLINTPSILTIGWADRSTGLQALHYLEGSRFRPVCSHSGSFLRSSVESSWKLRPNRTRIREFASNFHPRTQAYAVDLVTDCISIFVCQCGPSVAQSECVWPGSSFPWACYAQSQLMGSRICHQTAPKFFYYLDWLSCSSAWSVAGIGLVGRRSFSAHPKTPSLLRLSWTFSFSHHRD